MAKSKSDSEYRNICPNETTIGINLAFPFWDDRIINSPSLKDKIIKLLKGDHMGKSI